MSAKRAKVVEQRKKPPRGAALACAIKLSKLEQVNEINKHLNSIFKSLNFLKIFSSNFPLFLRTPLVDYSH